MNLLLLLFPAFVFSPAVKAVKCRLKPKGFLGGSEAGPDLDSGSESSPSSPSSPSDGGSGNSVGGCSNLLLTGWYPGWQGSDPKFAPSTLSWSKYESMIFSFAIPTEDPKSIMLDDTSQTVLPEFVRQAKAHGTKALLSVGGWSGSTYFSSIVGSASNRSQFNDALLGLVSKYNLDGIDFDWEYPGKQGAGCNIVSSSDSSNFLSLLQELRRTAVGSKLYLSAAVSTQPFIGTEGSPMSDVSKFADVLDHVAIMAYDINGSWSSNVDANAPLDDSCDDGPGAGAGSAKSAVKAWTNAGFPASKIALGTASYGHSFHVSKGDALDSSGQLMSHPSFNASLQPAGNEDSGFDQVLISSPFQIQVNAVLEGCGSGGGGTAIPSGVFDFYGLVDTGFLQDNGRPKDGIYYTYDQCSQTPYVYNSSSEIMVSYDDADSFVAKGKYIRTAGLKGMAMWTVVGDYKDILVDAIMTAMMCA